MNGNTDNYENDTYTQYLRTLIYNMDVLTIPNVNTLLNQYSVYIARQNQISNKPNI